MNVRLIRMLGAADDDDDDGKRDGVIIYDIQKLLSTGAGERLPSLNS